jgi:hypothetical protein
MRPTEIHQADSTEVRPDGGVVGTDEPLSTDAVFETLSSQRRRYTLHYLKQCDEPVTIRALSEQLAAWENGTEVSAVTPKQRKRVYTALHQTHLPKMDSLGVVTYDRDRGAIELRNHARAFDIYLEVDTAAADDLPWTQFYLALGMLFAGVVTVGSLGVFPFSLVPSYGYALVTALAFAAAAGYRSYRAKQVGSESTPTQITVPAEAREARGVTAPSADD